MALNASDQDPIRLTNDLFYHQDEVPPHYKRRAPDYFEEVFAH